MRFSVMCVLGFLVNVSVALAAQPQQQAQPQSQQQQTQQQSQQQQQQQIQVQERLLEDVHAPTRPELGSELYWAIDLDGKIYTNVYTPFGSKIREHTGAGRAATVLHTFPRETLCQSPLVVKVAGKIYFPCTISNSGSYTTWEKVLYSFSPATGVEVAHSTLEDMFQDMYVVGGTIVTMNSSVGTKATVYAFDTSNNQVQTIFSEDGSFLQKTRIVFGGKLFFGFIPPHTSAGYDAGLYGTDGTAAGTRRVEGLNRMAITTRQIATDGTSFYFKTSDGKIMKVDPKAMTAATWWQNASLYMPNPNGVITFLNGSVFGMDGGGTTAGLYRFYGGNQFQKITNQTCTAGYWCAMQALGTSLIYGVKTQAEGNELWVLANGGANALPTLLAGAGDPFPLHDNGADPVVANGHVFFNANDGGGVKLWYTNGQMMRLVPHAGIGTAINNVKRKFSVFDGKGFVFQAQSSSHGAEPRMLFFPTTPFPFQ